MRAATIRGRLLFLSLSSRCGCYYSSKYGMPRLYKIFSSSKSVGLYVDAVTVNYCAMVLIVLIDINAAYNILRKIQTIMLHVVIILYTCNL